MSLALADFLIELSNPVKLQAYRADPEGAMKIAGLDDADKKALRSEDVQLIHARSHCNQDVGTEPDETGTVTAILNGVLTLPPVVVIWAPPRWVTGYRSLPTQ